MSDLQGLLRRVVDALDTAGVPFMIAGSMASTLHGRPRTTQDIDVVIDPPSRPAFERLIKAFPEDAYYLDADIARSALRERGMFNVVDYASSWKIDFVLRKERAFSVEEFERRVPAELLGVRVYAASAEDTIVSKLEWSRMSGGSERQRRDVAGIIATVGSALDRAYVERWAKVLGVESEWALAQRVE